MSSSERVDLTSTAFDIIRHHLLVYGEDENKVHSVCQAIDGLQQGLLLPTEGAFESLKDKLSLILSSDELNQCSKKLTTEFPWSTIAKIQRRLADESEATDKSDIVVSELVNAWWDADGSSIDFEGLFSQCLHLNRRGIIGEDTFAGSMQQLGDAHRWSKKSTKELRGELFDLIYNEYDDEADWSKVKGIVRVDRDAMEDVCSIDEESLLHIAIGQRAPLDVLEGLLALRPDAVQLKNRFGQTLLHSACDDDLAETSFGVLKLLIEKGGEGAQEALKQPDNRGRLPLHMACKAKHPLPTIKFLVEMYPAGFRVADDDGCFPLDHAIISRDDPFDPVLVWLEEREADRYKLDWIYKQVRQWEPEAMRNCKQKLRKRSATTKLLQSTLDQFYPRRRSGS